MLVATIEKQLEQYTLQHPQEVLLVSVDIGGESDEILIFRGFSSSLVRATDPDPDMAVLPETATILGIDRLMGPYRPDQPQYLERQLSWREFSKRLSNP